MCGSGAATGFYFVFYINIYIPFLSFILLFNYFDKGLGSLKLRRAIFQEALLICYIDSFVVCVNWVAGRVGGNR